MLLFPHWIPFFHQSNCTLGFAAKLNLSQGSQNRLHMLLMPLPINTIHDYVIEIISTICIMWAKDSAHETTING